MERFAFKINKAVKESLCKICRLCGIDNDLVDKVPILNEEVVVNVDDEPQLLKKIEDCVGFTITKDDKMPQNVCRICLDKINDFYEFREMCYATNIQTRKLLGLKSMDPKKATAKPLFEIKPEIEVKVEVKETNPVIKRPRKRKTDDPAPKVKLEDDKEIKTENQGNTNSSSSFPTRKKLRLGVPTTQKKQKPIPETKLTPKVEINNEPSQILVGALKLKHLCLICDQRFSNKVKLERHLEVDHIPNILRFVCSTCNEVINKSNDIKNHQLWHKLSKTPYECALCNEKCISIYAYSRHLRLHCCEIYTPNYVLDRQCPQCKETFVTNFLYNIHKCALRTKKCAGCNRIQRSETDYLRHSAICSKTYLNYSKHIPAAIAAETNVWIKNENDVEEAPNEQAATTTNACSISSDMTPIVSLTRIPTPLLMSANQCVAIPNTNVEDTEATPQPSPLKQNKKNTKKGVLKRDLKRVDDLLKSTIDTFVSIKHEPEVHVDTDTDNATTSTAEQKESESEDNDFINDDNDFQNDDDDYDFNNELPNIPENTQHSLPIKQEKVDESYNESNVEVRIKKEVVDNSEAVTTAEKVPVLKIKIKKEHGTLNSSLIDECPIEKKKKKKKRKDDKERAKTVEKSQTSVEAATTQSNIITNENMSADPSTVTTIDFNAVCIKQEHVEETEETRIQITNNDVNTHPEATIMTSIPLLQFQISCVSSGVEFNKDMNADTALNTTTQSEESDMSSVQEEMLDVKPTQEDLNRMLQIMNVSSGVKMPEDENPIEPTHTKEANEKSINLKIRNKVSQENKTRAPIKSDKSKKIRAPHKSSNKEQSKESQPNTVFTNSLPYNDLSLNIVIKPEPCNRGYSDEIPKDQNKESEETNDNESNDINALSENQSNDEIETFDSNIINETNVLNESLSNEMDTFDNNETTTTNALKVNQQSDEMEIFNSNEIEDTNAFNAHQSTEEMEISDQEISSPEKHQITTRQAEEEAYIKSIDFSNIQIKQEKDIDIMDEHVDRTTNKLSTNKNLRSQDSESSSAEEDSDSDYDMSDEEEREYREMELPPALQSGSQKIHEDSSTDNIISNKQNISIEINKEDGLKITVTNTDEQVNNELNANASHLKSETEEPHKEIGSDIILSIQPNILETASLENANNNANIAEQKEICDKQNVETLPLSTENQEHSKVMDCENTTAHTEDTNIESNNSTATEVCIEQNVDKMPLRTVEDKDLQVVNDSETILNNQHVLCDEMNEQDANNDLKMHALNVMCSKETTQMQHAAVDELEHKNEMPSDVVLSSQSDLTTATNKQDTSNDLLLLTTHEKCNTQNTENPFLITSVYSQAANNITNSLLPVETDENGIVGETHDNSNQQQDFNLKISAIASGCGGITFEPTAQVAVSETVSLDVEVKEVQHNTSLDVQAFEDSVLNKEVDKNVAGTTESAIEESVTIEGQVSEEKHVTLDAQPFFNLPADNEMNENASVIESNIVDSNIEEAQNVINQARLDAFATVNISVNTENNCTENTTDIFLPSSSVNSLTHLPTTSSAILLAANARKEETDNIINENRLNAAHMQQELADQQQQLFHNNSDSNNTNINRLLLDNSNINEIAENNNNANIERELQDDNIAENVQVMHIEQHIAEDNVPYIAEHDVT